MEDPPDPSQQNQPHVPPAIERLGTLSELTLGIWGGIADVKLLAAS